MSRAHYDAMCDQGCAPEIKIKDHVGSTICKQGVPCRLCAEQWEDLRTTISGLLFLSIVQLPCYVWPQRVPRLQVLQ